MRSHMHVHPCPHSGPHLCGPGGSGVVRSETSSYGWICICVPSHSHNVIVSRMYPSVSGHAYQGISWPENWARCSIAVSRVHEQERECKLCTGHGATYCSTDWLIVSFVTDSHANICTCFLLWPQRAQSPHACGQAVRVLPRHAGALSGRDVLIARGRTRADRERRNTAVTPGKDGFFVCNGI